jgi:regulator of sigma E protease
MRVDEFGIGFPPKLFGIKRGETEYTLNLIPIGGFVKIFGEDVSRRSEGETLASKEPQYDKDAIAIVGAPDSERSFVSKSKLAQAAVLVAGVTMNVIFAWFLFALALGIGVQTVVNETAASENARLIVTDILPSSPAEEAGLTEGIVITEIRARDIVIPYDQLRPSTFSAFVEGVGGDEITLTYRYAGENVTTALHAREGLIGDDLGRPAIGVALVLVDVVRRPIHVAIVESLTLTLASLRDITVGISTLLLDAVRLDADLTQVAGPVGIVGLVGEASAFGITSLLMFTAFISLNLAIINLLPFPALDGGRLLFVGIEAVKGSPIRPQYVQILNTVGFALLILLMIAVTFNDISRIL